MIGSLWRCNSYTIDHNWMWIRVSSSLSRSLVNSIIVSILAARLFCVICREFCQARCRVCSQTSSWCRLWRWDCRFRLGNLGLSVAPRCLGWWPWVGWGLGAALSFWRQRVLLPLSKSPWLGSSVSFRIKLSNKYYSVQSRCRQVSV